LGGIDNKESPPGPNRQPHHLLADGAAMPRPDASRRITQTPFFDDRQLPCGKIAVRYAFKIQGLPQEPCSFSSRFFAKARISGV
jgi:hypothetical protein